jgi:hypothetical protein
MIRPAGYAERATMIAQVPRLTSQRREIHTIRRAHVRKHEPERERERERERGTRVRLAAARDLDNGRERSIIGA